MKKILFLSLLAIIVVLASCNNQNNLIIDSVNTVTFNISEEAPGVRSTSTITRYIVEIYIDNNDGSDDVLFYREEQNNGSFIVPMEPNIDYICRFWADGGAIDNNSTGTFNATNLVNGISLNEGKDVTEAFYGYSKINITASKAFSIILKRAIAEIKLIETGNVEIGTNLVVSFDHCTRFSIGNGEGSATEGIHYFKTFNLTESIGELGQLFTFASENCIVKDLTFTYNTEDPFIIRNLPLQANWITNIEGEFSKTPTSPNANVSFNVTKNEKWSEESNSQPL